MRLILIAAALALQGPISAHAQSCQGGGNPETVAISAVSSQGPEFFRALARATSAETIAAVRKGGGCVRADGVAGADTDDIPRVWSDLAATTPGRRLYLSRVPLVVDGKTVTAYALIRLWGSDAVRFEGLLDSIPTDARLAAVAKDYWGGGGPPFEFDEASGKLVDRDNQFPKTLSRAADRWERPPVGELGQR